METVDQVGPFIIRKRVHSDHVEVGVFWSEADNGVGSDGLIAWFDNFEDIPTMYVHMGKDDPQQIIHIADEIQERSNA